MIGIIDKMKTHVILPNLIMFENQFESLDLVPLFQELGITETPKGPRLMKRYAKNNAEYWLGRKKYAVKKFGPIQLAMMSKIENDLEGHFKEYKNTWKDWFNVGITNIYPTGKTGFRPHSDYDRSLETPMLISTTSFGKPRPFTVIDRKAGRAMTFDFPERSTLIMGPDFQRRYLHEVPYLENHKDYRVSVTFRRSNKFDLEKIQKELEKSNKPQQHKLF